MNPYVTIIAQYSLEFLIELMKLLKSKDVLEPEDFEALKTKYASKTADQYLAEAQARIIQG